MTRQAMSLSALALALLAACDATGLVDSAMARTAEQVAAPVIGAGAARCLVENATPEETQALARDIGVEAGTSTRARIAAILSRPGTMDCLARHNIAMPRV